MKSFISFRCASIICLGCIAGFWLFTRTSSTCVKRVDACLDAALAGNAVERAKAEEVLVECLDEILPHLLEGVTFQRTTKETTARTYLERLWAPVDSVQTHRKRGVLGLELLGSKAEAAVDVLVTNLNNDSINSEVHAALVGIGLAAVPSLMQAATNLNGRLSLEALRVLSDFKTNESVVAFIVACLASQDARTQISAALVLVRLEAFPCIVIPSLAAKVTDTNATYTARAVAAYGLGEYGEQAIQAMPMLRQWRASPDVDSALIEKVLHEYEFLRPNGITN